MHHLYTFTYEVAIQYFDEEAECGRQCNLDRYKVVLQVLDGDSPNLTKAREIIERHLPKNHPKCQNNIEGKYTCTCKDHYNMPEWMKKGSRNEYFYKLIEYTCTNSSKPRFGNYPVLENITVKII